jgi:tRNA (guanine-N7-)-methyltransferase
MARLRKAARVWRRPESQAAASRVLVEPDGGVFAIEPEKIFGRRAPLEIELGAGRGEFIIAYAAAHPERDFLAVELSGVVARMLAVRCGRSGVANLRVARMDARTLVNLMLADESVAAYHIYFPDPWPKERHRKHRLVTPRLVESLARTLAPGGRVHVASDVREWAAEMMAMLRAGEFSQSGEAVPGGALSGFARKYLAAGKPVYSASFVRKARPRGGAKERLKPPR